MAKVSRLGKELLLFLLKAQLFKAPLVSASPSCSPSQCPVQHSPAAGRKAILNHLPSLSILIMVFQRSTQFPASGRGGLLLMP